MKFIAWDIEIATLVDGEDWKAQRPLGISCAAYAWEEHGIIVTKAMYGNTWEGGLATPSPRMSQDECQHMVTELIEATGEGYTILTWNGQGFDWDMLAEESGMHAECCNLALNHVDMMFHIFCLKGFPLGLDAVAKGLGLSGKTEGMSGAQAPLLWSEGKYSQVLEYVQQDVRSTLEVALTARRLGGIHWKSKSGRANHLQIMRWLTVSDALKTPTPDTSWMSNPWPRSKFIDWMSNSAQPSAGVVA